MSKYQHLFFDLDHTLWDFEANSRYVVNELFETFHLRRLLQIESEDFFQEFTVQNDSLWIKYRNGLLKQDELRWKRFRNTLLAFKKADENLARELSTVYVQMLPNQKGLLPYAIEILDYCTGKGYSLHILTNGFEEVQHRKMENTQISHYFSEVITSERSMSLKPKKEIFDYALNASGAHLSNALMIGDNWEADIVGAQNAGMDQVFYNPFSRKNDGTANFEIKCLSELERIL